jgi:glycosyltransferase involved in cell wall biosynthesis
MHRGHQCTRPVTGALFTRLRYLASMPKVAGSRPEISVVIPTWNCAEFLGRTLESVCRQQHVDFECVVCDNHSTDSTEELCRAWCAQDDRVSYVRNAENLGMVANWNRCLELARGRFVKCLMSDDLLLGEDALAQQARLLREDDVLSLVTSARSIIDEIGTEMGCLGPLGTVDRRVRLAEIESVMLKRAGRGMNYIGEPSAVMFRSRDRGRGFSSEFRQMVDFEMWLRLLGHGDLFYIARPLCAFRQHASQQSALNSRIGAGEVEELEILRRHFRNLPGGKRRVGAVECLMAQQWADSSVPCLRNEAAAIRHRQPLVRPFLARVLHKPQRIWARFVRLCSGQSKSAGRAWRGVGDLLGRGVGRN